MSAPGDSVIYDLGNVEPTEPRGKPTAQPGERASARAAVADHSDYSRVGASLSLFLPGSGRALRGDWANGFFFLSSIALVATLAWSVVASLDRLAGTLEVLGFRPEISLWALGLIFVIGAFLYLGNVLLAAEGYPAHALPPAIPACASLVLPGWGQLLNGHGGRAALFLGGLWLTAAAWLLGSNAAGTILADFQVELPAALKIFTSPAVRWTLPAVIWAVAVYDAVLGAMRAR